MNTSRQQVPFISGAMRGQHPSGPDGSNGHQVLPHVVTMTQNLRDYSDYSD